jgi:hypothetical protein
MLALSSLQGYIFMRGYEQCIVVINLEPNVGQSRCIRQDRNVTSLQIASWRTLPTKSCRRRGISDLLWRRYCGADGLGCRLIDLCEVEPLELLKVVANDAHAAHVLSNQGR